MAQHKCQPEGLLEGQGPPPGALLTFSVGPLRYPRLSWKCLPAFVAITSLLKRQEGSDCQAFCSSQFNPVLDLGQQPDALPTPHSQPTQGIKTMAVERMTLEYPVAAAQRDPPIVISIERNTATQAQTRLQRHLAMT